jgi:hypothetical protein
MLARIRSKLTYANVVASLALFIALGTGGAYAANTIRSGDIVDGEVKTPDIANGAVNRDRLASNSVIKSKLNNSSVDGSKVGDDSLGGADIVESSLGEVPSAATAQNAQNAQNAQTATSAGKAPIEGYSAHVLPTDNAGNIVRTEGTRSIDCPAGKRPLGGGGVAYDSTGAPAPLSESKPIGFQYPNDQNYPNGWFVKARNFTPNSSLYIGIWVVCAKTDLVQN